MANENKNQRLGIKALEERVEKFKAELAGVADEIAELEKNREADMSEHERQLGLAKLANCNAIEEQKERFASAAVTEGKGRALVASGEKLLAEAREQRAAAEQLDMQLEPIRQAEFRIRERREHWRDELARIQSSSTRRKRAQLEQTIAKLERRVMRKVEPEPVRGTGQVGTGSIGDISLVEQPVAVLTGLLAGTHRRKSSVVEKPEAQPEAQPESEVPPAPASVEEPTT